MHVSNIWMFFAFWDPILDDNPVEFETDEWHRSQWAALVWAYIRRAERRERAYDTPKISDWKAEASCVTFCRPGTSSQFKMVVLLSCLPALASLSFPLWLAGRHAVYTKYGQQRSTWLSPQRNWKPKTTGKKKKAAAPTVYQQLSSVVQFLHVFCKLQSPLKKEVV